MLEYVMEYTNCVFNPMIYYLLECFVYCAIYMCHYDYHLLQFWDLPLFKNCGKMQWSRSKFKSSSNNATSVATPWIVEIVWSNEESGIDYKYYSITNILLL
jgi:hypothetical protein